MTRKRSRTLSPAERQKRRRRKIREMEDLEGKLKAFQRRSYPENNPELLAEMRKNGVSFVTPDDNELINVAREKIKVLSADLKELASSSDTSSENLDVNHVSETETADESLDQDGNEGAVMDADFGNYLELPTQEEIDEDAELAKITFPVPNLQYKKRKNFEDILAAGTHYINTICGNSAPGPSSGFSCFTSPRYVPPTATSAKDLFDSNDPDEVRSKDARFYERYYMPAKRAKLEEVVESVMNDELIEAANNYDDSQRGMFHQDDEAIREELTNDVLSNHELLFEDEWTQRETVKDRKERIDKEKYHIYLNHDDHQRYLQNVYDDVSSDEADDEEDEPEGNGVRIDQLFDNIAIENDIEFEYNSSQDNADATPPINAEDVDDCICDMSIEEEQDSLLDATNEESSPPVADIQQNVGYHFLKQEKSYKDICKDYWNEINQRTPAAQDAYFEQTFLGDVSKLNLSERAARHMWDRERAVRNAVPFNRRIKSYKTVRNKLLKVTPKISLQFEIQRRGGSNKKRIHYTGDCYPEKKYPRSKYETLSVWTNSTIEDVFNFHQLLHKEEAIEEPYMARYDLCMDGVPLSVSGIDQMTILCVRFEGCQTVYELGIFVYRKGKNACVLKMLQKTITRAYAQCFYMRQFIADSPMRAKVKCLKGHNGFCACDRCLASGTSLSASNKDKAKRLLREHDRRKRAAEERGTNFHVTCDERKELKEACSKGKNVIYDSSTMDMKRRTHEHFLDIYEKLTEAEGQELPDRVAFGIKGKSVLLADPGVDMVETCDIEPMHNIGLGMCKKIVNCILQPRKGEATFAKEKMDIVELFDNEWREMSIPCEFNRRPRPLNTSLMHYKAEEFISLATCGFLAFANALVGPGYKKIRQVWLIFTYLVMAALLPQPEYDVITFSRRYLEDLHKLFYKMYEKAFGKKNCTYNTHVFYHLPEVRKRKRLDEISAEPFEASFQYVKKIITNNTCSFSKTVMQKAFINKFSHHSCGRNVTISPKNRMSKSCDNHIFARTSTGNEFFQIHSITDNGYMCIPVKTEPYINDDVPFLNYEKIGVRRLKGITCEHPEVIIPKKDVIGKAILYRSSIIINVSFSALHM